jgi:hypothetical protein
VLIRKRVLHDPEALSSTADASHILSGYQILAVAADGGQLVVVEDFAR